MFEGFEVVVIVVSVGDYEMGVFGNVVFVFGCWDELGCVWLLWMYGDGEVEVGWFGDYVLLM